MGNSTNLNSSKGKIAQTPQQRAGSVQASPLHLRKQASSNAQAATVTASTERANSLKLKNAIGITPKRTRPTSSFRSIGRQHPTQMTKFLTRPDEGKFFSLTYNQGNDGGVGGFLDR